MSFDARHHQGFARAHAAPSAFPAALAAVKVSPEVLGKIGEAFSVSLSAVQASLSSLGPLPAEARATLDAGLAEIARLEGFGLQIQALARVLAGTASMPREHLDLARAARDAITQWNEAARRCGARIGGPSQPVELDANAAAVAQLLDLGLEHALHAGRRIDIGVATEGLSQRPVLTIRAQGEPSSDTPGRSPFGALASADLHWLLFADLAHAVGLVPHRLVADHEVTLTLSFPVADVAMTTPDAASAALPHTGSVVGRRVLLIEPRDMSRVQASRLMSAVGMRVTAIAHIDLPRASLRDESPDVVVTGIALDDIRVHALLDEARAAQPRLRVIELVDDASAFDFSVPGSDSPARVGRHDMATTLVRAVSQELDAAWSTDGVLA